jgi:hypothetical protein
MGRSYNANGEKTNGYGIWVGKPEGKRPLGRPRRRCMGNIESSLRKIEWGCIDYIDLAQDRDQWNDLIYTVINFRVP